MSVVQIHTNMSLIMTLFGAEFSSSCVYKSLRMQVLKFYGFPSHFWGIDVQTLHYTKLVSIMSTAHIVCCFSSSDPYISAYFFVK